MSEGDETEVREIELVIARQFASLNWTPGADADWSGFAADFHPEASLFPSARPAKQQTPEAFIERMKGLARSSLLSLEEKVVGTAVHVYGNVATAVVACEMVENGISMSRNVEMLLLVKSAARWQIVSQAWDKETPSIPMPVYLTKST
jgi:hypothetical protein